MFKLDLEKAEEPEFKLPIFLDHRENKGIPEKKKQKSSTSALLTTPNPLTVWITMNCGKFLKRCEYYTTLPAS